MHLVNYIYLIMHIIIYGMYFMYVCIIYIIIIYIIFTYKYRYLYMSLTLLKSLVNVLLPLPINQYEILHCKD